MLTKTQLIHADVLDGLRSLKANSVHVVVTSPPYWAKVPMRNYGTDGQLGREKTAHEHIEVMLEIAKEIRRVLHPSGTFWMNYGDSHLPNKMLVGMPWRLALAFADDLFVLRSDIIWRKSNPLCSSTKDRPPTTHEYIFLFSKKNKYYYDFDAIREKTGNEATWDEYLNADGRINFHEDDDRAGMLQDKNPDYKVLTHPLGRGRRSVWDIPVTKGFVGPDGKKHFAQFPRLLPELCIKAGSSEKGCCPTCLEPWKRTYEIHEIQYDNGNRTRADVEDSVLSDKSSLRTGRIKVAKPIGWEPGCKCGESIPIPCTVLDCFNGYANTGMAAINLQRNYVGIDNSLDYLQVSAQRLASEMPLFNRMEEIKTVKEMAPF